MAKIAGNHYKAIESAVVFAADGSIATDFGIPAKAESPSAQVILSILQIAISVVSGGVWNKC